MRKAKIPAEGAYHRAEPAANLSVNQDFRYRGQQSPAPVQRFSIGEFMFHRRPVIVYVAVLCLFAAVAYGQQCPTPVIVQTSGINPSCTAQPITLEVPANGEAHELGIGQVSERR